MLDDNRVDLSGTWQIRWADGERGGLKYHPDMQTDERKWMDAQVPGEVHLDLMRLGLIEDPCIGKNHLTSRWVETMFWSYRKKFVAPDSLFRRNPENEEVARTTWLVFEGLDCRAWIYLNGIKIAEHSNYFRPCRVDVSRFLKRGENLVVVTLEGGLSEVAGRDVRDFFGASGNGFEVNDARHKRLWLRKPQCSFGWDWAPRYINVGIHGPVWLEWADEVRIDQMVVLSDFFEERGIARIRLFVEGVSEACDPPPLDFHPHYSQFGVPVHLRSIMKNTGERIGDVRRYIPGELKVRILETSEEVITEIRIWKGMQCLEAELDIEHPELWWPIGQGPQTLYTAEAELRIDGRLIGRKSRRFGIRHVEIDQSRHPQRGSYFIINVNGCNVFAKGASFVPSDMIFARIDRNRTRTLVDRAAEANFNMLRVWGGGMYESDEFYDACDEAGIMVWQEFAFACSAYPGGDSAFVENFMAEAEYNIRRLASHPSLIIWCGNNEQEWQAYGQTTGLLHPDHALFHQAIPRLLKREDPFRYYQASSPMTPGFGFPNDDHAGDQHPWSVGFANADFRDYRNMECRFPNEGGIIGPTSLAAVHACLEEGQIRTQSFSWQLHDNGIEQLYPYSIADNLLMEWLGLDVRKLEVDEYIYYGGLLQGEGLREYIDNFRRREFDSASAIFWMFNDCWPATRSWTIVDYFLNRTPSFHPVRRAFAAISVVLAKEGESIAVYGINDTKSRWTGELEYGIFTTSGQYILKEVRHAELDGNRSTRIAEFDAQEWERIGTLDSVAYAVLHGQKRMIARNRLILHRFKEMKWSDPSIAVTRDGWEVVFSSNSFVLGVCIDLKGETSFPDNFFDLWPGIEYRIPWNPIEPLPIVLHALAMG